MTPVVHCQTAVIGEPDGSNSRTAPTTEYPEGAVCLTEAQVLVGMMPGLGKHEHRSARQ